MKKLALLALATLTLVALPAEARWHMPWNHDANPLQSLLDPNGGIPILHPADLRAIHAIAGPAIANGAGYKIKAADNCALAWLNHPEYLTQDETVPVAPSIAPATAGPLSKAFVVAVKIDADVRGLEHRVALFSAPLPDDIMIACAPLVPSPGGIVHALHSFLHPAVTAAGR